MTDVNQIICVASIINCMASLQERSCSRKGLCSIACFVTDNSMQLVCVKSLVTQQWKMAQMGLVSDTAAGHGLVMKIGDFGMSRQVIMRQSGDEVCLERALSANVIGTAAYSAPELLLADSPVKKNRVDAATVLKSDVSLYIGHCMPTWPRLDASAYGRFWKSQLVRLMSNFFLWLHHWYSLCLLRPVHWGFPLLVSEHLLKEADCWCLFCQAALSLPTSLDSINHGAALGMCI